VCNDVRNTIPTRAIHEAVNELRVELFLPEGSPNAEPREHIRITDRLSIIRPAQGGAELVVRRWSWPGPTGKPVFNYVGEKRRFPLASRCLIPVDGFYEYTAPNDPKQKLKDQWLFTLRGSPWFCVLGIWRKADVKGEALEAFTMLTVAPGPDIAPFHDRQIVVHPLDRALGWITGSASEEDLIQPLPAGALEVAQVR
jgi:putative SOS response-associated peptidase YedK